jgi:hypothetical protein
MRNVWKFALILWLSFGSLHAQTMFGPGPAFGTLGDVQISDYPAVLALHYPGITIQTLTVGKEDTQHNTFRFRAGNPSADGLSGIDVEGNAYFGTGTGAGGMFITGLNLDPNMGAIATSMLTSAANSNKLLLGWNRTAGRGEHDFMSGHNSSLPGGIRFYDLPSNTATPQLIVSFDAGGALLTGNLQLSAENGSNNGAHISFPDSTIQSTAWTGVLSGGDYAESVDVSGGREMYEPGDVLVINPSAEGKFLKSSTPYSTAVTGIYSTRPGVVGRRQRTAREHMKDEVPMAMTGIVPTKVSAENGPIHPGIYL